MMAKRTQSIRRHNMSDGFFSSEEVDQNASEAVVKANLKFNKEFKADRTEDNNHSLGPTPLGIALVNM